jgi:hypothetical protein
MFRNPPVLGTPKLLDSLRDFPPLGIQEPWVGRWVLLFAGACAQQVLNGCLLI